MDKLLRFTISRGLVLLLASLLFGGCQKDDAASAAGDDKQVLQLSLATYAATADPNATADESAVSSVYVYIFNEHNVLENPGKEQIMGTPLTDDNGVLNARWQVTAGAKTIYVVANPPASVARTLPLPAPVEYSDVELLYSEADVFLADLSEIGSRGLVMTGKVETTVPRGSVSHMATVEIARRHARIDLSLRLSEELNNAYTQVKIVKAALSRQNWFLPLFLEPYVYNMSENSEERTLDVGIGSMLAYTSVCSFYTGLRPTVPTTKPLCLDLTVTFDGTEVPMKAYLNTGALNGGTDNMDKDAIEIEPNHIYKVKGTISPRGVIFDLQILDWEDETVDVDVQWADLKTDCAEVELLPGISDPVLGCKVDLLHATHPLPYELSLVGADKKTPVGEEMLQMWVGRPEAPQKVAGNEIGLSTSVQTYFTTQASFTEAFSGYLKIACGGLTRYLPIKASSYIRSQAVDTGGPANCFLVPPTEGLYSFDARQMGNGADGIIDEALFKDAYGKLLTKAGGAALPVVPLSAKLLWQQFDGVVRQVAWDAAAQRVHVAVSGKTGNALIAVYDTQNPDDPNARVLWSWHLWIAQTPQDLAVSASGNTGYSNIPYTLMDRALGALSADPGRGGWDRTVGLLYNWGVKNPFFGRRSKKPKAYDVRNVLAVELGENDYASMDDMAQYSVLNPLLATASSYPDPLPGNLTAIKNYWGASANDSEKNGAGIKTIYDPCPAGYRVAPLDAYMLFTQSISQAGKVNEYIANTSSSLTDEGFWVYYQRAGSGPVTWFPCPLNGEGDLWGTIAWKNSGKLFGRVCSISLSTSIYTGFYDNSSLEIAGMNCLRCTAIE